LACQYETCCCSPARMWSAMFKTKAPPGCRTLTASTHASS
jgi:hypothetical protein